MGENILVNKSAVDQEFTDTLPRAGVLFNDPFNLFPCDYATLDEKITYAFAAFVCLK